MSLSPIISRDIVNMRLLLNAIKREKYMDTLRDAVVGDFKWSACNNNYNGWLICDGSALNRVTYSSLYNVIGTTHGTNTNDDFKIPDCRGRILAAPGTPYDGANTLTFGTFFGSQTHTLSVEEMPTHSHTGNTNENATTSVAGTIDAAVSLTTTPAINSLNYTQLSFTTQNTGDSDPHDIQNPTIVVGNVFIYSGIFEPYVPTVDIIGPNDNTYNA